MRPRRRTIEALLLRYFSTTNQPERGSALSLQFLSLSRQKTPTHTHTHTHTPEGKPVRGMAPNRVCRRRSRAIPEISIRSVVVRENWYSRTKTHIRCESDIVGLGPPLFLVILVAPGRSWPNVVDTPLGAGVVTTVPAFFHSGDVLLFGVKKDRKSRCWKKPLHWVAWIENNLGSKR
jgi:hypothetical protein